MGYLGGGGIHALNHKMRELLCIVGLFNIECEAVVLRLGLGYLSSMYVCVLYVCM